ncbi:zinc finger C2HC domain-containing protein 1A-like isoform X2 [Rhopilema esculentum]|uniref:zinc finger C2HC domain-containing protein 1A-like isoform X2 n=1 Tax=Rhopilema esculentum TaxID=499914 RepID=UPI0031CE5970
MAEYEAFRDIRTPSTLHPCSNCGRTFNPETLQRHEKVCNSQKQRRVFDSSKMRLQGTEAATVKRKPSPPPSKTKISSSSKDKSNWRAKHENLIATLKAARGEGPAVAPTVDPGYVECPYCTRNFNEYAAERHIPFCKEQNARLPKNSGNSKSKLTKRTQYKPPLPGSKKGSSSSLASDGGTPKQRPLPAKGSTQTPSSGGIAKRSPAPSPTLRRKNAPEQTDSRVLRRQSAASPPPQRQNEFGSTRAVEKNYNYNEQYQARQKQQQGQYKENYRASSGSSSDSDAHRVGSGKQPPAWLKDFKKTEDTSILPERKTDSSSASSKGRHSGRQRETSNRDVFDFDEKPIKPIRRNSEYDTDDFGPPLTKPTAVGVVRPSSRDVSGKEDRTPSGRRKLANFCHECGTKYPVQTAKFCCECGVRRMHVEQA